VISGMAVYYDPPLAPKALEEEGSKLVARARRDLEQGNGEAAETKLREAIERYVDAFLLDRGGHSSAFVVAHRIGAFVSKRFGCPMKSDDGRRWNTGCGVWALHSRFGSSIGGTTRGNCSICSAGDLECDHIPGQRYDDELCVRIIFKLDLNEISVVPFPEDPRTYRLELSRTTSEIEDMSGEVSQSGAIPTCVHCEVCPGTPTAEDIDQTLWDVTHRMNDSIEVTLIDASRHGREPSPATLRERSLPASEVAEIALRAGQADVEAKARAVLRDVVDAFLGDRKTNQDLFERAHQFGGVIAATVGCWWTEEKDRYVNRCPVFALHRRVAHSLELTTLQKCSICGAEPLSCDHLAGLEYEGEVCVFEVTKILPIGAVAWTADPEFTYTWHRPETIPTDQLIREGVLQDAGEKAACTHCLNCTEPPTDEDLDPVSRFRRLATENGHALH
jgi:hypothetical protein